MAKIYFLIKSLRNPDFYEAQLIEKKKKLDRPHMNIVMKLKKIL